MAITYSPALEAKLQEIWARYPEGRKRSAIIPMLIYAQDEVGSVTPELVEDLARRCEITPLQVEEVVGYYSMLHKEKWGKHHVQICTNIACLLMGGEELWHHATKRLGIGHRQVTADGLISLEEVECAGACAWAPCVVDGYEYHHHVTVEKLDQLLDSIQRVQ
ncbi:MAG: NAD(P)H-dependent oxidoreductase subunit E [Bryobacter sp.]|nr:NAD(P)H-dependent oxidoreductase subunit E [Bryobacter sp.]